MRQRILWTLLLVLVGCTRSSTSSHPLRIGFVLATLNEERYLKDRQYFLAEAEKLGVRVEFAACDNRVDLQTSRVENLLAKEIDALVIQPVHSEAASAIARAAKADGVPVVAYDRLIRNAPIDLYVTQNSFQVGVLQAERALSVMPRPAQVVILSGEAGHSVADEITRGNRHVLDKASGVKVVVQQNHPGWSTALALSTVENALTRFGNQIHGVLANNDGMALGAVQALEEQGLAGRVFVAGADADLTAVRNLVSGKQSMTVLKGVKPLAEAAARAAVFLARHEKPPSDAEIFNGAVEVPVLNTPVEAIVPSNVRSRLIETGYHPASAIYGEKG